MFLSAAGRMLEQGEILNTKVTASKFIAIKWRKLHEGLCH